MNSCMQQGPIWYGVGVSCKGRHFITVQTMKRKASWPCDLATKLKLADPGLDLSVWPQTHRTPLYWCHEMKTNYTTNIWVDDQHWANFRSKKFHASFNNKFPILLVNFVSVPLFWTNYSSLAGQHDQQSHVWASTCTTCNLRRGRCYKQANFGTNSH